MDLLSRRDVYCRPKMRALAGLADDWPPYGRGLPIGSSTSQLFAAQVYLNGLDHFVKRQLKAPTYVRYGDDMFVFGDRRGEVRSWRRAIGAWLWEERGLRLKHPEARILSCRGTLHGLGYRITREGVDALPRALKRLQKRVVAELLRPENRPPEVDIERSIASTAGTVLF